MRPWVPIPLDAAHDATLLTASAAVQALVWRLAALSVGGRVATRATPEATVTALCGGAPWAVDALGDATGLDLVRVEDGALVLPWTWPAQAAPTPPALDVPPARAPRPERTFTLRDAERRLGALWSKAGAKTPDQRKTWLDSAAGRAFLRRESEHAPDGVTVDRAWAEGVAARVRTVGVAANHGQPLAELATANPTANHGQPGGSSSPPGAPAPSAVKSGRGRGSKAEPTPDTIPAAGTPARSVYDAIVNDTALRPITDNPGDFALRITDPATYPGVNVLAEVKRAGEWASTKPKKYTDGRAFLRNWLQRKADDAARAPKPAPPPAPPPPAAPKPREPAAPTLSPEETRKLWKQMQEEENARGTNAPV